MRYIMTNEKTTDIYFGIYDIDFNQFFIRNSSSYSIPPKFMVFIKNMKNNAWQWKYRKAPFIFFTIGVYGGIQALSIVHPKESTFNFEKGIEIVEGRLSRQRGLMKRPLYDRIQAENNEGELIFTLDEDGNEVPIYKEIPSYIITGD